MKTHGCKHYQYSQGASRSYQSIKAGRSATLGIPALLLGGLTYGLVCPSYVTPENAAAVDATVTASVDAIISISAPETVALSLTPTASGSVFTSGSASVKVTTNSAYGYSLSMGTSGSSTALTNSSNSSVTIPTLSSSTTYSTFSSTSDTTTTNKWGFTTNNNGTDTDSGQITANTYLPLTSSSDSTLIKKTDTTASADTTTVTFGVKVNKSQLSGSYSNTVVFSAVANPRKLTIFDIDNMQDMTADVCTNTTTPAATALTSFDTDGSHKGDTSYVPQATLTDTRDSSTYTVRKLADGNCWMTQNLALGGSSAITLKSSDSDVTSDFTLSAQPTTSFDSSNYRVVNYRISSDSSYGGYYNWYTATAGTGTASMPNGSNTSVSICPKGWTLPTGDSSSQFQTLYTAYSSDYDSLNSVFPLTLSGYYSGSSLDLSDSYGTWWSSTAYGYYDNGYWAYDLAADDSGVYPADYFVQCNGQSVRCVARSSS